MKKLMFFAVLGMSSVMCASEPVTVQVISAIYEKSVTKEFDKKLKKSGLDIHKNVENSRYVVTLGAFKDGKNAGKALKNARNVVSSDAFVRPVERHFTAENATHTESKPTEVVRALAEVKPIDAVPAHSEVKPVEVAKAVAEVKSTEAAQVHSEVKPVEVAKVLAEAKPIEAVQPYTEVKPVTLPLISSVSMADTKPMTPVVQSICDKRDIRKDEFAEAIRYYKTSPYHRFESVGLRQ
ncbi:MAG: hypothetical protein PHW18_02275 [Sulfuricurvum sp.]|uniref:hypothetical protein n=1 Tax=Sulfuricurvum sp. TaxID=2025608 RepID=UPI00262D3840|nr:hypothetical protein [Sulfuricurvum sp.]MDD2828382.1 hypothetical protein [Sulfuricurvum sp.]MDD4949387.1 hypothetical protein [Sulfuricurvum sp.]